MSNIEWFRYSWVWEKEQGTNFLDAHRKPYKVHEDINVFCESLPKYHPQYEAGLPYINGKNRATDVYGGFHDTQELKTHGRLPKSLIKFNREVGYHPTQKPVSLLRYLLRTYTVEGETILDNTMGSGSTIVAAIHEGRNAIGIERDADYFAIAQQRCLEATYQPSLFTPQPTQWEPVAMFGDD